MPCKTEWVDPELFMEHAGVKIYHTYVDDDVDQGRNSNIFSTEAYDDEHQFHVRDLDVPSRKLLDAHPPFLSESSSPEWVTATSQQKDQWRKEWADWLAAGETAVIRAMIIEAIEAGIIKNED